MNTAEEMASLKARVTELEVLMAEVKKTLGIGRTDDAALQVAMDQLLSGNNEQLTRYIKHGGKIPRQGMAA